MGQRGPQPKPTATAKRHGTYRADRHARNEPRPAAKRPPCPRWMRPEAKALWRRLAPELERAGVLTAIDGNALSRYCLLAVRWKEAELHIAEHGAVVKAPSGYAMQNPYVTIATKLAVELRQLEREFGMTPSARSRIEVSAPTAEPDDLEKLLARNGNLRIAK